jgi:hypothetical protein
VEWSDKTRNLQRQASVSAMRDVVKGFFREDRIGTLVGQLEAAGTTMVTPDQLEARLARDLTKDATRRVVEIFSSADDVRVPAGPSWMRAAQAVSAVSQDLGKSATDEGRDGSEQVLGLERLAGQLMVEGAKKAA